MSWFFDVAAGVVGTFKDFAVGFGTREPTAALQVISTTKTFLLPRMTTAEREAIAATPDGSMVYDTTLLAVCVVSNGVWYTLDMTLIV